MDVTIREEILNIKPYTPGKPIEEVQKEYGLKKIIKLASNENPLGPSKLAQLKMNELLQNVHIYPDGNCSLLKEELSNFLNITADELIIGNGSDEILKLLGEAYLKPNDEVVMADPTFSEYQYVARLMGATEKLVPLKNYTHDLARMVSEINDKTKIVFICNPNNPTGTIVDKNELSRFLQDIPDSLLVVIDEAYYEYVQSEEYPDSLNIIRSKPNVLITRTFSKIYGLAGLRIGYGVANPEIISNLNRVREPFNVNQMAQIAALASISDQKHVIASVNTNEKGKQYLYKEFTALDLDYVPTEANFVLVDVKENAETVFQKLLKKGVIVRSAHIFGLPTFLRITIGTQEQNEQLISSLKEVLTGEDSY